MMQVTGKGVDRWVEQPLGMFLSQQTEFFQLDASTSHLCSHDLSFKLSSMTADAAIAAATTAASSFVCTVLAEL